MERAFLEKTGHGTSAYRKLHGVAQYYKRHQEVMAHVLETHTKHVVIICSFADLENDGKGLLQSYAQTHPVIHVLRDTRGIQSYLKVQAEKVDQLLFASGPLLRSCTNFDFFNLSDTTEETVQSHNDEIAGSLAAAQRSPFPSLTLKRAERDFLKFLRQILGDHRRGPSHRSAYPLSNILVERRNGTYCAVVSVRDIVDHSVDLDELQVGADAVELVVDLECSHLESTGSNVRTPGPDLDLAFATLRRSTILPIVLTVSSAGGSAQLATNPEYSEMIVQCLRLAPEYIEFDLSMSEAQQSHVLAWRGSTKIIGHSALLARPEKGWEDAKCVLAYEKGRDLDCAMVKITMPAEAMADNFAVQVFRYRLQGSYEGPPLIAYNTGRLGRLSQCFNSVLTPVRTHRGGIAASDIEHNDVQITAREATRALFASFAVEPMHCFIFGGNVSYSLSPAMHNAAFEACGMPHTYGTRSSSTLDDLRPLIYDRHFGGAAVTQPYKTEVISLLQKLSPHATAIGAVNTIIPIRNLLPDGSIPDALGIHSQRNRQGEVKALYGDNTGKPAMIADQEGRAELTDLTDWIGIRACIRRGLSPANTVRPSSCGLVCGAGGMARSAVYAMISLGVANIFICNRTVERAHNLAEHYNGLLRSGALHSGLTEEGARHQVHVIESVTAPWPETYRQPTMVVCCIPAHSIGGSPAPEFTVPSGWIRSPTGGVVVEVSLAT